MCVSFWSNLYVTQLEDYRVCITLILLISSRYDRYLRVLSRIRLACIIWAVQNVSNMIGLRRLSLRTRLNYLSTILTPTYIEGICGEALTVGHQEGHFSNALF